MVAFEISIAILTTLPTRAWCCSTTAGTGRPSRSRPSGPRTCWRSCGATERPRVARADPLHRGPPPVLARADAGAGRRLALAPGLDRGRLARGGERHHDHVARP